MRRTAGSCFERSKCSSRPPSSLSEAFLYSSSNHENGLQSCPLPAQTFMLELYFLLKFIQDLESSTYLPSQLSSAISFTFRLSRANSSLLKVTQKRPCFRPRERQHRSAYARQNEVCCCHVARREPHADQDFLGSTSFDPVGVGSQS